MSQTDVPTDVCADNPVFLSPIAHLPSHVRLWGIALAALALDLGSKAWIFDSLPPHTSRTFLPYFVEFHRSLNDGAVFGSFKGQISLFIIASVIALGFVLYLFIRTPRTQWMTHCALALILAGALGNLYDRAFVQADKVETPAALGGMMQRIGRIVEETEEQVRIGDWPEGTNAQWVDRSHVVFRNQGVVRDFIKFIPRFPKWVPRVGGRDMWPWVFNVADAALVCGVGALLLSSWMEKKPRG